MLVAARGLSKGPAEAMSCGGPPFGPPSLDFRMNFILALSNAGANQ
jgi:hypothetical protein